MLIITILSLFGFIPFSLIVLLFVPILFWIGQMQVNKSYQMPYVYWVFVFVKKLFVKTKEFNKKYNKTEEVNLTVEKK
jgi:predicted membrane metal-binding protein